MAGLYVHLRDKFVTFELVFICQNTSLPSNDFTCNTRLQVVITIIFTDLYVQLYVIIDANLLGVLDNVYRRTLKRLKSLIITCISTSLNNSN